MKVEEGKYSILELTDWFHRKELVVNSEYQRGAGLWPTPAKSYFIDTVLKGFPFPKVYFYERMDKETKRPRREIVDGQQRITTLVEFADGKFALGKNAIGHEGRFFNQLSEDEQESFYGYTVSVDVIRNATRPDLLQMFRRMNAFTLPLNAAEKRHSEFFGEFKDWVNTLLDRYGSTFVNWGVLTSRQVVRSADAEFIADLALAIEEGVVSTSPAKLASLYKANDTDFRDRAKLTEQIHAAFDAALADFSELQKTYIMKTHVFHSFLCALIHNRFGLPDGEQATTEPSTGHFFADRDRALASLKRLAIAHEEKDESEFVEYVKAASEGGNRVNQRAIRIKWLCRALQGQFA